MIDFTKAPLKLDERFVLSKMSEGSIFSQYFGSFEFKKGYRSVFRKDSDPSTGFYINRTGRIIYNDLKTGEKLNCFAFVAKKYGISYGQALRKVAEDFGLIYSDKMVVFDKTQVYEIDEKVNQETQIQIQPSHWTKAHLNYWKQYGILEPSKDIIPVAKLWLNGKFIPTKEIRFAFVIQWENKVYMKIYSPSSKNMKWLSNIPLYIPFGFLDLPKMSDTVYITKSRKDMEVLKTIFTDVIATQNESESALSESVQKYLLDNYKNRIIIWDNDDVGVENCKKFNDKGFGYFNIPREDYEMFGIKDCSDYVSYYGLEELKKLLKTKGFSK